MAVSVRVVFRFFLHDPLDLTMVVAMVAVRVVQMTTDEIIDMVAVWNALVSAARSMDVVFVMFGTRMIRCALGLVRGARFKDMVVNMVPVDGVQVTVVQIIDVAVVFHGDMAATDPMGMCVTLVLRACHVRSSRKIELLSRHCAYEFVGYCATDAGMTPAPPTRLARRTPRGSPGMNRSCSPALAMIHAGGTWVARWVESESQHVVRGVTRNVPAPRPVRSRRACNGKRSSTAQPVTHATSIHNSHESLSGILIRRSRRCEPRNVLGGRVPPVGSIRSP
jgi:hypothetical protein